MIGADLSPKWSLAIAMGLLIVLLGAPGIAQSPSGSGYLAGREPDTVSILPQAPGVGSARDTADRDIFRSTRALKTNAPERWALARRDADVTIPDLLADFSCALDIQLDAASAPALTALLRKLLPDMVATYSAPKDLYRRPRPYLRDEGDLCIGRSDALDKTFDYPSGHATFAWTVGLILTELAPERAGALLARARAFGESRAVCGVHSASAVAEARTAGAALVAALHGDAVFRADVERARSELAALRTHALKPKADVCAAETALTRRSPW